MPRAKQPANPAQLSFAELERADAVAAVSARRYRERGMTKRPIQLDILRALAVSVLNRENIGVRKVGHSWKVDERVIRVFIAGVESRTDLTIDRRPVAAPPPVLHINNEDAYALRCSGLVPEFLRSRGLARRSKLLFDAYQLDIEHSNLQVDTKQAKDTAYKRRSRSERREHVGPDAAATSSIRMPTSSRAKRAPRKYRLSDFAVVRNGIVPPLPDAFLMTSRQLRQTELPHSYFSRAIPNGACISDDLVTNLDLALLDERSTPTYLLAVPRPQPDSDRTLHAFLSAAQAALNYQPLEPDWYCLKSPEPAQLLVPASPFLQQRFIRNDASAHGLSDFLSVRLFDTDMDSVERLWRALNDPDVLHIISTHTGRTKHLTARALSDLPIPSDVCRRYGLVLSPDRYLSATAPTRSDPSWEPAASA